MSRLNEATYKLSVNLDHPPVVFKEGLTIEKLPEIKKVRKFSEILLHSVAVGT